MNLGALSEALSMINIKNRNQIVSAVPEKNSFPESRITPTQTPTPTPMVTQPYQQKGINPFAEFFSSINPFDNIKKPVPEKDPNTVRVLFRQPKTNQIMLKKPSPTPEIDKKPLKAEPTTAPIAPRNDLSSTEATTTPSKDSNKMFYGVITQPPPEIGSLIWSSAEKAGISPALLAAVLLQESGYQTSRIGEFDPNDIGIAQINLIQHPEIKREQALDPNFAIPYAANLLASHINHFGDINRGLAAYNVGRGGANNSGDTAFGGGPRGQAYIDAVSKRMSEDLVKELGLKTSYY